VARRYAGSQCVRSGRRSVVHNGVSTIAGQSVRSRLPKGYRQQTARMSTLLRRLTGAVDPKQTLIVFQRCATVPLELAQQLRQRGQFARVLRFHLPGPRINRE
jgi:hypothetical protein